MGTRRGDQHPRPGRRLGRGRGRAGEHHGAAPRGREPALPRGSRRADRPRQPASLRERVGASGLPARLGGDEFAVLLPGAGEQEARDLALSLLQAVRSRETRVPVTASAGISVFDAGPTHDPGDALVAADIALYEAKEGGRDRVATFTGQQGQRLTWVGRIRRAVEAERLVLHSQPIVNLATGDTVGEELLVRMLDESGELVMPSAFLPTAERFGLIRDIDRWVVSRALELIATGRRVSVNLSARSVSDPELM